MKTCPVCQSSAFDDAKVCYGCMYRFDDEVEASASCADAELEPEQEDAVTPIEIESSVGSTPVGNVMHSAAPRTAGSAGEYGPAFFIKMTPALAESGQVTWACAVELAVC